MAAPQKEIPQPPFDASHSPPFECFFQGCSEKRDRYLPLMRHIERVHKKHLGDFVNTYFHTQVKQEKHDKNKKRPSRSKATADKEADATAAGSGHVPKPVAEETGADKDASDTLAEKPEAAPTRQVFCLVVEEAWASDQANGEKSTECTVGKSRFNKLQEKDLVIISGKGGGNKVAAVCEALAPPITAAIDPEILRPMVKPGRFKGLKAYLKKSKSGTLDYFRMSRAFDARGLEVTAADLVNAIGAGALSQGWQQRFVRVSGDAAVYNALLERVEACPCHQHSVLPSAAIGDATARQPARATSPPPAAAKQQALDPASPLHAL